MALPAPDTASIEARRAAVVASLPDWRPLTLAQAFDRAAGRWPARPCIITDAQSWTYAEVRDWSVELAAGLIGHGLQPGEHVALVMANYPAFVAAKLAIARAGAVCVPINFLLRGRELVYILDQSDSIMLITMDRFRGHDHAADLAGIAGGLPALRATFFYCTEGGSTVSTGTTLDDLAAAATPDSRAQLAAIDVDATALSDIIYTSGTTGRPKGVMLTHDMILRAAFSSAVTCAFEDGRRIQFAMPMYHVFGYVECMVAAWFAGGAIIPHIAFDPGEMLDMAERHRTSELVCVPMMTTKLIELARTRGFDPTHLTTVFNSGGVNSPSIWHDIRAVLGARELLTGYGMTETTASTTCTLPEGDDRHLVESNGRFKLPSVAGDPALGGLTALYKVIDPETGADLPFGAEGELVARGPIVTRGYYKKPEETAAAFTPDGVWLHTGDVGRVSADGYLRHTGRIKESYRCNGEMVMPREIEELFDDHPGIVQALVVGIADPRAGEVGCLCIVPRAGVEPDAAALLDHIARQLARFKLPRHVVFMAAEDIPLTVTGRPQKFKLAKIAAARIAAQQDTRKVV